MDVAIHPPVLHAKDGTLWTILGHAAGQKHHIRAQEQQQQRQQKERTLSTCVACHCCCRMSVARHLSTIMLLCTNVMFLACSMSRTCYRSTTRYRHLGWRAPSLACGTGGRVATSTKSFTHFHHGKVVKNIKIWLRLARCSCQLILL